MVKRGSKKPPKIAKTDRFPLIEKALRKRTKADLIETILMIARDHPFVARELDSRLDVEKPLNRDRTKMLNAAFSAQSMLAHINE